VEKETGVLPAGDIGIGDRVNMAFSNSNVTYGRGKGVVVNTGMSYRFTRQGRFFNF
jgi:Ca2+-transporting ATPase